MKKHVSIVIFLFSLFLSSCGGITETGEGSISFDAGQISRTLTRNVTEDEKDSLITLELATIGDYVTSVKKTFTRKDENPTVTLDNIPVGSQIRVKVILFYGPAEKQKILEGLSDEFTVMRGENKVTVKLKGSGNGNNDEEVSTDIILYNKVDPGEDPNVTEANYALYRFNNAVYSGQTNQTPKNAYSQSSKFTDFVVGLDNKIYYTNGSDLYCDNERIAEIALDSHYDPAYPSNICISDNAKALFYMDGQTEYSLTFGAYDLEYGVNSNAVDYDHYDITEYTCYVIRYTVSLVYEGETQSEGTVVKTYKGFLYLYCGTFNNKKTFMKVPMTYEKIVDTSENTKAVSISFDGEGPEYFDLDDYFPEFTSYDMTDMTIQDGVLYALLNYRSIQTSASFNSDLTVSIKSAIITIDLDDFGAGCAVIGQMQTSSDEDIINLLTLGTTGHYGKFMQPENENGLFGLQKFVAVKPKKLVMAEDGIFFYKDGDEYKYKNINRIREYDIEHDTFETYSLKTNTLINFDNEEEGDLVFRYNTGTASDEWHDAATFTEAQ
ncbi:hypothetical protein SAMN04487775_106181 [Treponema bryantii]|uniref:Lipoprotein n=1 Tax=Treponema bryantii TaxID=163 RepID=A0A1I3LBL0_9SPIR|nr:hypothetical protein [Treponema bryantii]SFI82182.1 hypothetical protein SAMN04487775_106181 [Treponema bryantii]